MTTPTADDYRALLQAALPVAVDADTMTPDLRTLFTPETHRLALDPDVTVVRGARGSGKTVWFRSLQAPRLQMLAAATYRLPRLNQVRSLAGYGIELSPERYPGPVTLADLVASERDTNLIWTAVLLTGLGVADLQPVRTWADRVDWVRRHPDAVDRALADADQDAAANGTLQLVLFDALDRLHRDRTAADRLVEGILRLALELRTRTRHLRAKIFIRPDMLSDSVLQFPDASKLVANAADLEWSSHNLYGLLFHLLGNAEDPRAASFRSSTPAWNLDDVRYIPPRDLVGDEKRQRETFVQIAGPYMGANHRKGVSYTWLPNHLKDGIGQVSPRSFLTALARANSISGTRFAGHEFALHWDSIRQGVQAASRARVHEVTEDMPWVGTAVGQLQGLQVPIEQSAVLNRWAERHLTYQLRQSTGAGESTVRTGPQHTDDHPGLVEELISMGFMTRRSDGRLDLPDVYRIAFGVGRKGGVPRLRR